ncbi:hypothetical protein CGRA01v4_07562 [Colletotrichum graminicola]|nr:hypothetical protein CGRA01v4_07562 [Colletotrichum graminicola]
MVQNVWEKNREIQGFEVFIIFFSSSCFSSGLPLFHHYHYSSSSIFLPRLFTSDVRTRLLSLATAGKEGSARLAIHSILPKPFAMLSPSQDRSVGPADLSSWVPCYAFPGFDDNTIYDPMPSDLAMASRDWLGETGGQNKTTEGGASGEDGQTSSTFETGDGRMA